MSMIFAMVKLDFRLIRSYSKSLLLLIFVIGPLFSIAFHNTSMMAMYLLLSLVMTLSYPFAVTEKRGAAQLYDTLPLSAGQRVWGRYAFAAALTALGLVLYGVLIPSMSLILSLPVDAGELVFHLTLIATAAFLIAAYQFPMFFLLGYDKARLWAYVPFILLTIAGASWQEQLMPVITALLSVPAAVYPVAALALLCLSGFISSAAMQKRGA